MEICRNDDFLIILEKNELLVVDILTLSVFHRREYGAGSVIGCCSEYAFVGNGCAVVALCLLDLKEKVVCEMKAPVTAIFHLDGFVYCGSEDGTIHVYGMAEENDKREAKSVGESLWSEISNEMFPEEDFQCRFGFIKSMKHPGPVTQICSDGTEVFVADLRNKITVYPSKRTYDIRSPKLRYKNYIFASERNMLYCRTRNAFATYLTVEKPINSYTFSMNGGILFAQCRNDVYVIEFNTRKIIKKIHVPGRFVYDDDRNRLVWFDGKKFSSIENVLENGYGGMEDVVFREDELAEKKIRVEEVVDEGFLERHKGDEERKRAQKRRYFKVSESYGPSEWSNNEERKRMIDSDEYSEEVGDKSKIKESSPMPKEEAENLLYYNSEGYMICIRGESFDRVEVIYHDISRRKIEVPRICGCVLGSFCKDNVVVGDGKKIYYTGKFSRWEKEIEAKMVSVSEKMVVVFSGILQVFGLDGTEVFNCLVPDVHAMCCHLGIIAVFCRELILIDLFKSTERLFLPSPVDFACFDETGRIFYRVGGRMYQVYNGLPVRVCEVQTRPLAVVRGSVISLGASRKLFPSPHVEYTKFDVFDPFEVKNEAKEEDVPSHENQENKVMEVSKSKRYNPLGK
ncbi:hypothetical protein EROM_020780 [Encephalitozoon romaleae SJ-2008]|uniref:Uncharacterized protein n=1 Tax=Encephalitozoon romaleae (strain SJ-2008) TaxID=1178016 RepID=I6ZH79_ENCRO|nr:hypothetical protein EROM_020780 [Encephalitozoon romaleae SJ-2008]AFN82553.1 hypothetical protein EROM_020780 [Encephalitozoon romaleae SJ-2008]